MQKEALAAYFAMIIKSVIYGMSFYFTSGLLESTDAIEVLALRFLMGALAFSALVLFKVVKVNYKNKNIVPLICAMIFEPIGYFIFETFGLMGTTTTTAGLINSLMPAFIVVCEMLILRETTTKTQKFLILLRMVAGVLIVCNTQTAGSNSFIGVTFVLLSVVSGALFLVFSRKASRDFSSIEITYAMIMVGAVVFNAINIIKHLSAGTISLYFMPYTNCENLIGFVFLGVLSSVIATMLSNYAIGKIQVSHTSAFGGLATVVTLIAGVALNGEVLYWYHYISIILIFTATVGMVMSINKEQKQINSNIE